MNKIITSKEAILAASRAVIEESGMQALNMRAIALKCGVSVGSVYNYFPSKGDLTIAAIQSVWMEIMHGYHCSNGASFSQNVQQLFLRVQAGTKKYPSFFNAHSINIATQDKSKAKDVMQRYLSHIQQGLAAAMDADKNVNPNAFDDKFTKEQFADFVFANIMSLIINGEGSCDVLLEVIKRTIY